VVWCTWAPTGTFNGSGTREVAFGVDTAGDRVSLKGVLEKGDQKRFLGGHGNNIRDLE